MPATDGLLDEAYVDALGIRVHRELQRLGEELQFGRRVAALRRALLVLLALLDGTFSGFRSSVGRTGLIEHQLR